MQVEISQETVENLIKTAQKKSWMDSSEEEGDEFIQVNDWAAGNIDDAFWGGVDYGEISQARNILNKLNIKWKGE